MSWDYAELSHMAKEFGGPEGLVSAIYDGGILDGRIQGALGMLSIGGIAIALKKLYDSRKAKAETAKIVLAENLKEPLLSENLEAEMSDTTDKKTDASTSENANFLERLKRFFNGSKN